MNVLTAANTCFQVPMFDPVVANHFNNAASYTGSLLHQINTEEIYALLFKGKKDLTFLDLGANIGLVSIYAAPSCKRIVAVEPAPDTFTVLRAMTHSLPQIELVQAALADEDGPEQFHVNDINSTASSTVNTYGTKTTVSGLTLSSILSQSQLEHVDVAKIDVEGAEEYALNISELEMAAKVIRTYMIECHNTPTTRWYLILGRLMDQLMLLGYKVSAEGMTVFAER